jgi:class 3 adenylate cyclase
MLESYASRLLARHLRAAVGAPSSRRESFEGVLLFLDIVGSTAMSEQFAGEGTAGAEKLARILNLHFGDVFDVVAAHGGDTVRIEGDAVLALWDGKDAALRAAQAAVALRDAFMEWRPGLACVCGTGSRWAWAPSPRPASARRGSAASSR